MAIYHLHCDIIGRAKGQSVVGASAYRSTTKMYDEVTGITHDYTRKEKALYTEIMTSKDAPEWAKNRERLWNEVEKKENRKNSQFCRSFDMALPKELSIDDDVEIIQKWVKRNYIDRGLVADFVVHPPHRNKNGESNENIHCHILVTTRKVTKDGWGEKDREGNDKDFLRDVRTDWADICNEFFKRRGLDIRIDERSLEEQGIDREPQQHQGKTATALQRKGKEVNRKKYKSQQEKNEEKVNLEITQNELNNALAQDPGYKQLIELLKTTKLEEERENERRANDEKARQEQIKRIEKENEEKKRIEDIFNKEYDYWKNYFLNMTPSNWERFLNDNGDDLEVVKKIKEVDQVAQKTWIEQNIADIENDFKNELQNKKKMYQLIIEKRPNDVLAEPSWWDKKTKLFMSDNGEKNKYDEYKKIQKTIINNYNELKIIPARNELDHAQKNYDVCKNRDYEKVKLLLKTERPSLFEKMKNGIANILNTSKKIIFIVFKAIRRAYAEICEYKNRELENYKQQRRNKSRRNNDRDFYER